MKATQHIGGLVRLLPRAGTYRVHVLNTADSTWYELQDLHVIDVLPQMVALSETYIQIYKQV